jgi:hypothetical protein
MRLCVFVPQRFCKKLPLIITHPGKKNKKTLPII